MRKATVIAAFVLAGATWISAVALADDRSDVEAATARWIDAFNRKSTPDILALYAPDAVLFGTSSPVLRDRPELLLDYFRDLPGLGDARITVGEHRVQLFGEVALSTGFYTRTMRQGTQVLSNPARFTFVYHKRGNTWLIVNHHSSALPQP